MTNKYLLQKIKHIFCIEFPGAIGTLNDVRSHLRWLLLVKKFIWVRKQNWNLLKTKVFILIVVREFF